MGGPFTTYAPPGVYTRTLLDPNVASLNGAIRVPVFIGVGDEEICFEDVEIFRGSSAIADNEVYLEDVSSQLDGTNADFTVTNFPITTGLGTGTVTTDPDHVAVYVNGERSAVSQVRGSTGEVFLANIPFADDEVKITYFFNKTDTLTTDDLSIQADGTRTEFKTNHIPIVDGTNGGITTTAPADVTVLVNDAAVVPSTVVGRDGLVTLPFAPAATDTVTITYYFNKFANTADPLPLDPTLGDATRIIRVGISPGRSDFIAGTDFVLIGNEIHWGNTYTVENLLNTAGSTVFDETQISLQLLDNTGYFFLATPFASANPDDADKVASGRYFVLPFIPTNGSGRGTPINVDETTTSDNTGDITAYVGPTVALAKAAGSVRINTLDGSARLLELETAPPAGSSVYVTQYYNLLADQCYVIENTLAGGDGVGEYTITTQDSELDVYNIAEAPASHSVSNPLFATEGITWPNAFADLQTIPGFTPLETITVTFTTSATYTVSSSLGAGGSSGTGQLDQTYIDSSTGVRFTIQESPTAPSTAVTPMYSAGDTLVFTTFSPFLASAVPHLSIPGARTTITTTEGVGLGDQALLCTYNQSGQEPPIGDFYFVSYCLAKIDFSAKTYTRFQDVIAEYGSLRPDNTLTLAAYIAFLNGASIIGLKQVVKVSGSPVAATASYLEALIELEDPMPGNINPAIVVPLTTDSTVQAALLSHVERQSSIRFRHERIGIIGVAVGTEPTDVQELAPAFKSNRIVLVYPDGAVIPLVDELGQEFQVVVDGTFLAVAFSAINVSAQFDVATSMTRKQIVGFQRLIRKLTSVDANQTAVAGVTIFEQLDPIIQVRQSITTDPTNVLTRELSITTIADYVQQQARFSLDQFIGVKLLPRVLGAIVDTLSGVLQTLVNAEIITAFTGVSAVQDDQDPTIVRVEAYYQPVFPLNWIVITFNLRARL